MLSINMHGGVQNAPRGGMALPHPNLATGLLHILKFVILKIMIVKILNQLHFGK